MGELGIVLLCSLNHDSLDNFMGTNSVSAIDLIINCCFLMGSILNSSRVFYIHIT